MSRSEPEQQALPITVIVCRRGRRRSAAPCSTPGCSRTHELLCDFPLRGAKAGKTCDAKLCETCATSEDPGHDYCPPHAKFLARAASGTVVP